jgi:hypothetical protein
MLRFCPRRLKARISLSASSGLFVDRRMHARWYQFSIKCVRPLLKLAEASVGDTVHFCLGSIDLSDGSILFGYNGVDSKVWTEECCTDSIPYPGFTSLILF